MKAWQRNEFAHGLARASVEKVAQGDLAAAQAAFEAADGDFVTRFLAAVEAAVSAATRYEEERHVRIPADYEQLSVPELEALVRPFADGILPSKPTRAQLLDAVKAIDRRQREHAQWAPHTVVDPLLPPPQLSDRERWELGDAAVEARLAAYKELRREYYKDM